MVSPGPATTRLMKTMSDRPGVARAHGAFEVSGRGMPQHRDLAVHSLARPPLNPPGRSGPDCRSHSRHIDDRRRSNTDGGLSHVGGCVDDTVGMTRIAGAEG
jgi:hypothetical protein